MNIYNYLLPLVSVMLGYGFSRIVYAKKFNVNLLLVFSGSFLFSLMVFHLLPEIYAYNSNKNTGIYIILGVLIQMILEFFSKGAEHGHVHFDKGKNIPFPWVLFISLSIHSILEGVPIGHNETLLYGIVAHKFPVAVVLTTLFMKTGLKLTQQVFFISCFAMMTPIGSLLGKSEILESYHVEISAVVVGVLLHISSIILFESSKNHRFNIKKLTSILIGFISAYMLHGSN